MSSISEVWKHAHSILHISRQVLNTTLEPLNLTSAEGNVLLHILLEPEGLKQDDLVSQLDVTKGAVSRALYTLSQKGYVTRKEDVNDRRAQRIYLTDAGHKVGPELEKAYDSLYDIALKGISDIDLNCFLEVFQHMAGNFTSVLQKDENKK